MKIITALAGLLIFVAAESRGRAQSNFINFDDGTIGSPVGSFYNSRGVIFTNAMWYQSYISNVYCPGQATAPLLITSQYPQPASNSVTTPIVAIFTVPQQRVSILGFNVGFAGARIDAYDSATGGLLVASTQAFGQTLKGEFTNVGCAEGWKISEQFLLQVSSANITRVELYRPNPGVDDGVFWDNLAFETCSATCPPLSIAFVPPSEVMLSWTTCAGATYQVEYSTNLIPSAWTPLYGTNIPGTGLPVQVSDHTAGVQRFFRLKCGPDP